MKPGMSISSTLPDNSSAGIISSSSSSTIDTREENSKSRSPSEFRSSRKSDPPLEARISAARKSASMWQESPHPRGKGARLPTALSLNPCDKDVRISEASLRVSAIRNALGLLTLPVATKSIAPAILEQRTLSVNTRARFASAFPFTTNVSSKCFKA